MATQPNQHVRCLCLRRRSSNWQYWRVFENSSTFQCGGSSLGVSLPVGQSIVRDWMASIACAMVPYPLFRAAAARSSVMSRAVVLQCERRYGIAPRVREERKSVAHPHAAACSPVCSSVLLCTPAYSNVLQRTSMYSGVLWCTPVYSTSLQCTPVYSNVLQCTPVCSRVFQLTSVYSSVL